MVVNVCRSEGEEWTSTTSEQQLSKHEKQNGSKSRRFAFEAIISPATEQKRLNKLFHCTESLCRRKVAQVKYLKLLCVAKAGFDNLLIWWPIRPRPMSCSRTDTRRQMLSSVLLSSIMLGFSSPMKCGMEKSVEPIPIITAPETSERWRDLWFNSTAQLLSTSYTKTFIVRCHKSVRFAEANFDFTRS